MIVNGRPMTALGATSIVTLGGTLASAGTVLVFELGLEGADARAEQSLPPLAAAAAMALFAIVMGALSSGVVMLLRRRFPIGLVVFAAASVGIGIWLSGLALAVRPAEAPMYIVLHVVFVVAFGLVLPYWLYRLR
jgi:hypothetical protein